MKILTVFMTAALLAACAPAAEKKPTLEQLMGAQELPAELEPVGKQWAKGQDNVEQGRKLVEEGQRNIGKGDKLVAKGRAQVKKGETLMKKGAKLQDSSQEMFEGETMSPIM